MQALENSRDWPSCLAQSLARALRGIVTIVTVVALSGCSSQEIDVWRLEERAAFDPDAAAHPGGPVDFQSIPISTTLPAIYTIARSWSEQDFIELTRAFDTSRHRSTPSSLRVWRLRLEQGCIQVGARPDLFSIDWFAPLPTTGNRIDRVYIVYLRKGSLYWSEGEVNPDSAKYAALRAYSPGVTYAQALAAADAAGGSAFRAKVGDNCEISALRNSGLEQGHWRVSYVGQDWFLEVVVHAGTGSILSLKEGARSR